MSILAIFAIFACLSLAFVNAQDFQTNAFIRPSPSRPPFDRDDRDGRDGRGYPSTTQYFTTRGLPCTNVNLRDIPSRIDTPQYCTYINNRNYNLPEEAKQFCYIVQRVQNTISTQGIYNALKTLRDAWNQYGSRIPFYTPPDAIRNDPFKGCVPLNEMPLCFQNSQNSRALPRTLPLFERCIESSPRFNRRNYDVSNFCNELKKIKSDWDRNGPQPSYVTQLQRIWTSYKSRVELYLDEEVPFYYTSY